VVLKITTVVANEMNTVVLGSIKASGTSYPDRRDEFVRVLWCRARSLSHTIREDQKRSRQALIRAATSIATFDRPIRTTFAAIQGAGFDVFSFDYF
jgi:7-cyano-7-deazaguanine synthase in queuosine biosynthesis